MATSPELCYMGKFLEKYDGGKIYLKKDYWNEGIALVCIEHLEKRNAISGKMYVDFMKCVQELENWKNGKAFILYGEGTNFCAGGDLDFAKKESNSTAGYYMSYYMHHVLKKIRKLPLISVSLVHGATVGGGAEISTFCDYILVSDNTKLGFVQGRMGITTAWGGGTRLVQIVGQRKALEFLASGKVFNAQECLKLDLAYKIVSAEQRLEQALDFVRGLTAFHSTITQSMKLVTEVASEESLEKSLDFERNEFYTKWGSDINKEAVSKNIKFVKK
ncbi:ethylmalonyl-CoA decarboxylase-like [Diabrotica virgifera virgifera]|uniref:Ethylmalonyl-CoA decarboxylase-like n=1 Tax=Diabrotica virgifera virgifera TaxID=50390 RepID=A0A6P7H6P3_DIAVI|nr:ethylmalonyl-CoA decarboxylase-like [Diabrotica virgifera virgifera]